MEILNMRWQNSGLETGRVKGINLKAPKEGLSAAAVEAAMNTLITLKVIPVGHDVDYAAIVDTQKNELFNLI